MGARRSEAVHGKRCLVGRWWAGRHGGAADKSYQRTEHCSWASAGASGGVLPGIRPDGGQRLRLGAGAAAGFGAGGSRTTLRCPSRRRACVACLGGLLRRPGSSELSLRTSARLASSAAIRSGPGRLLGLGLHGDLLARGLALDQVEHALAVLVLELGGVELGRQRLDQLLGHGQLALGGLGLGERVELVDPVRREHLVAEQHRRQRHRVAGRPQRAQLLLGADHDPADGDLARLAHRLEQQPVGLGPAGGRRQVVGVVVVDRVDLGEIDELLDVDRLGRLGVERVELLGLDQHVAVGRELVALDDVLEGDLVAGRRVDPLLADASAGLARQLVEADRLGRGCAVELDGHVDQPEADRAGPDCAGHHGFV